MNPTAPHSYFTPRRTLALFILLFAFLSSQANLRAESDTPKKPAALSEHLSTIKERLNLTEEQKSQIIPILISSMKERREILEKYGIQEGYKPNLSRRQKISLAKELKAAKQITDKQLYRHLNETQQKEYKKIQKETRTALKAKLKTR